MNNEDRLILIVIKGMCEGNVFPSIETLCLSTGHSRKTLFPILYRLSKEGKIAWINEDAVMSVSTQNHILTTSTSVQKII
ncbi:hypothetical protein BTS2_0420 [Bacillus sp. TS-2]|nr:hypothetical protein BTS2_0420 [Bacillus sp. TS-2]